MTPTSASTASTAATLAEQQAIANFESNRAAVARSQPDLQIAPLPTDLEWLFGRDRALTLRDSSGNWLTGCSLPRRSAAQMLKKLNVTGQVACFLAPTHGAQLRIALDRLRAEQAIVAIVPQTELLPALLACDFFADDLNHRRLWFAVGDDWSTELKRLFDTHPGLCTPTQFIRLPILEEELVDSLIAPAQKIFGDISSQRASSIRTLRESYRRPASRPCVVTSSQFRLWDDAGHALGELFTENDATKIDVDDPANASPFALAKAAANCDTIVIANTGRSDLPGVLPDSMPWITWTGGDRIPSYAGAAPIDRIITASPTLAARAGWPSTQIVEASHPLVSSDASTSGKSLALICDTNDLSPPPELTAYSSHGVLWEMILADLRSDPFTISQIDSFLDHRMRKLNIAAETLNRTLFVRELIIPAFQQSLARLLLRSNIALQLHGGGWDRLPEFAAHAAGPIKTRQQFQQAVSQSAGLVHAWPHQFPHAIDTLGKPVLYRRGVNGSNFLNDAKQILAGKSTPPTPAGQVLTGDLITAVVKSIASQR